jgi:hypothetical protein
MPDLYKAKIVRYIVFTEKTIAWLSLIRWRQPNCKIVRHKPRRPDREPALVTEGKVSRLKEKVAAVKAHMQRLKQIGQQLRAAPDGQVSLTDPDARSMATSGRGTGIVGYNVQTAVDTKHHLIVAHEVTNVGHDRTQLFSMAKQARSATGKEDLTVVADLTLSQETVAFSNRIPA